MSIRILLTRGIPVEVVTDLATGETGARGIEFCIPATPAGLPTVTFTTQGTVTALVGNLQITQDDGTTWRNFIAVDFVAQPVLTLELSPGAGYRFNFTTTTLTGTVDIKASLR